MREDYSGLIREIAKYIIEHKCTIRQCAEVFGLSKSTVHGYMHVKLKYTDIDLYDEVQSVLDYNFSVRHLRGGESTKNKYLKRAEYTDTSAADSVRKKSATNYIARDEAEGCGAAALV